MSYGLISILVISRYAAPPYPAAPDFLHGKACHTILRSLCSLTNRVPLPPHPGDRINRSMLSCRDMAPWLSIHSPTTEWGEGGGVSHQRGNAFPRPQDGCMVFAAKGGIKNGAHKGAHIASAAVLHNSRGRSPQPVREAPAGPGQNLGSPGPSGPAAPSTLTPVRACQPTGILESTALVWRFPYFFSTVSVWPLVTIFPSL